MEFYDLTPEEYLKLDVSTISPLDLKELSYYIWCCHEDNELLLKWRKDVLLPLVDNIAPMEPMFDEDLDGE